MQPLHSHVCRLSPVKSWNDVSRSIFNSILPGGLPIDNVRVLSLGEYTSLDVAEQLRDWLLTLIPLYLHHSSKTKEADDTRTQGSSALTLKSGGLNNEGVANRKAIYNNGRKSGYKTKLARLKRVRNENRRLYDQIH